MIESDYPMTQAIRVLTDRGAAFTIHSYSYEEHGGTGVAARELGVAEHEVVKTLVFETDDRRPLLVLMHGDKEVSAKALARRLGVKAVTPCSPDAANKHTGYMVGGVSPFGTRKRLPVYMEQSIAGLPRLFINAGKRGLLAEMAPADVSAILEPILVEAAV